MDDEEFLALQMRNGLVASQRSSPFWYTPDKPLPKSYRTTLEVTPETLEFYLKMTPYERFRVYAGVGLTVLTTTALAICACACTVHPSNIAIIVPRRSVLVGTITGVAMLAFNTMFGCSELPKRLEEGEEEDATDGRLEKPQ